MTNPVKVIITVTIVNIINMINGSVTDRKAADRPNAKNG